jgi:hypothetical protein
MQKLVVMMMLIVGAGSANGQEKAKQDFKKLYWLNGTWVRTNLKAGQTGLESWILTAPEQLTGNAITKKGEQTIVVEKLSLTIKDGEIYYIADVTGNTAPVLFKLTVLDDFSFTCENLTNDFPKKIVYTLNGNKLLATISGGGKSIDYHFEKK